MRCRRSALATVALVVALLLGALESGPAAEAAPATPAFGPDIEPLAAYAGQTTCDPTPKPGALALEALVEATYPSTSSFGIGRPCDVGGQSEHKEGRAFDWAVNASDPAQVAIASDFLTWMLATDQYGNADAMARRLGIMYIIWNRQVWKSYAADRGWQPYTGPVPHTDHVHFSLSWDGADALTSWYRQGATSPPNPPPPSAPEPPPSPTPEPPSAPVGDPAPGRGYWLMSDSGLAYPFAAPSYGALPLPPQLPVVGMAPTPSGAGYWGVAGDGGIFSFGDAVFLGSTGGTRLNKPILAMAATPSGKGYWLVASDGGIFSFGDAAFFGSTGAERLNKPIVGMAATPSGRGYWLVASDGGIFTFGDAAFLGSTGAMVLNQPIVGMAPTGGGGYWLVASDGGIFTFGNAGYHGSTGATRLVSPIRGMAATATGEGYWLAAGDGGLFSFGDAPFQGSAAERHPNVVGIARYL